MGIRGKFSLFFWILFGISSGGTKKLVKIDILKNKNKINLHRPLGQLRSFFSFSVLGMNGSGDRWWDCLSLSFLVHGDIVFFFFCCVGGTVVLFLFGSGMYVCVGDRWWDCLSRFFFLVLLIFFFFFVVSEGRSFGFLVIVGCENR